MKSRRALAVLVLAVVVAAVLGVFAIGERTPPRSPTEQVPITWRSAREAPMHVLHVGEKKIACTECHASPDAAPTESACTKCHERETKTRHRGGARAPTTCLACHAFGAGPAGPSCNECHAKTKRASDAPVLEHHATVDLPCGACHSVHGEERAVLSDCTTCHRDTSAAHGRFEAHVRPAGTVDASLDLSLDAAVLAFVREAGAHAGAFTTHEPSANGDAHAAALEPGSALAGQVCTTCHAPHAGKEAARATCEGCHTTAHAVGASPQPPAIGALAKTAPHVVPRGARVAGHEACVTCHEPHRARRAEVRACEGCHADRRAIATVRGHGACTGCHSPHAPAEARTSCSTTCHSAVTTLGATRVAAHADCTSCHDPHRPEVSAGQACVRCHESVKPSHPAISSAKGEQSCIGCHAPHGGREASQPSPAVATVHGKAAIAAPCSSCHTKGRDDHAFHAKGVACTSCHEPHAFQLAGKGASLCAGCHGEEAKATHTRPGHASCNTCHGAAHAPVAKPWCSGCHVDEAKTAPKGHATCTSCHDAHSGSLGPRASCTTCHENKAKAMHANAAQGCATCHRPHGPKGPAKPVACSSCHAKPSLKGLHAIDAHAPCETCHSAHSPPRSDRTTCTGTCHADRRSHQPEARLCKGCHLFRQ